MKKTHPVKILIIEDDLTMSEGLQTVLEKDGYPVVVASDGAQGSRLFRSEVPDLVITDLKLPVKSGLQLLREFRKEKPDLPVILISAYGSIDLAVNALKSGARDFIAKPFSIDELRMKVDQIVQAIPASTPQLEETTAYHGLVGSSKKMQNLYDCIKQVAGVDSPVLITGESGTGKELIARAIHEESGRKNGPFLAVNCGGFTETLLASELFGHEKGSFTDAVRQHQGIFEQADTGTILLDEVGEVPPSMQVQLLRVLQQQSFHRVGGNRDIQTDVRIIAATNKDLKEALGRKEFREDLFYRLNVLPINVPPLRDRQEDIPELLEFIGDKKCVSLGRTRPKWSEAAVEKIKHYAWPGNIRELENFLERILIFNDKESITGRDLYFDDISAVSIPGSGSLTETLEETEREMIRKALEKAGGVKQQAARILGIKTSTLYYKMEKYGFKGRDLKESSAAD